MNQKKKLWMQLKIVFGLLGLSSPCIAQKEKYLIFNYFDNSTFSMIEAYGKLTCHPKGGDVNMYGYDYKMAELAQKLKMKPGDEEEVYIYISKTKKRFKTMKQLGYLFSHLGPLALRYLQDMGWSTVTTKELAVEKMKEPLGFIDTHVNNKTGETIVERKSIASASAEELSKFVENLFYHLLEEGYEPLTPESYRKNRKRL